MIRKKIHVFYPNPYNTVTYTYSNIRDVYILTIIKIKIFVILVSLNRVGHLKVYF